MSPVVGPGGGDRGVPEPHLDLGNGRLVLEGVGGICGSQARAVHDQPGPDVVPLWQRAPLLASYA